jgi:phytoene desaturase
VSRIVVIGAGVGGLAAAARLAGAGHEVVVHERSPVVGGKLGVYDREGFVFDTGPSLLTMPHLFDDLAVHPVPLDPVVRHVFPDRTVLDSSSCPEVFLERIAAAMGAGAAADWARFWRRASRIWEASWRSVLRRPVTPASLVALSWRVGDVAAIAPWRSLRALGRHYLRDVRLRMMLDRYATYAGADPRRAPAALAAIPYAELTFGGWYLPGGLGTLAAALLARCRSLGVSVVLDSPVSGICVAGAASAGAASAGAASAGAASAGAVSAGDFPARPGPRLRRSTADGRVSGVRLASGQVVPADIVVSDVDALTVYRDLLPTPSRLGRLADRSLAGFVLLLGVRGTTPELAHHTVFFPSYYDAEFDAVFGTASRRARPASNPAIFITRAADPAVHPPGHEAWFVLVNAPRHGTAWSALDWSRPGLAEDYRDHILAVLAARGLDVRDRLLFAETRTPRDLADATAAPGGAIYGTAGGLLRPPNRGPVPGLWLVGGSTHPGGGLPMVTLSAQIVADAIGPASAEPQST